MDWIWAFLRRVLVTRNSNCLLWCQESQAAKISLMLFFHQENGLNLVSTSSNTLVISQLQELTLLDLEKCLIKSWWKDRPEKVVFVQLEKNYSANHLMKSSDKSLFTSQKEVSFFWELEMKLKWPLPLIKPCIKTLQRSPWENKLKQNMAKLIWKRQSSNLQRREPICKRNWLSWKLNVMALL